MKQKYLEKLEYIKILEVLSSFAKTDSGKELCLNLRPFTSKEKVQEALKQTTEAANLKVKKGTPPISYFTPIDLSIKKIESGSFLSISEILEVSTILTMSRELKEYFNSEDSVTLLDFPILERFFSSLYTNLEIEKNISSKILDNQTLDDKASQDLYRIRKEMQKLEGQIKEKLNHFIHSATYSKYIQENVIMIRNDRYVIPVKEEYRSQIKGFIHDFSSSGSTVFIEPVSIFDLNNTMNQLKIEESIEIEKILQKLSSLFFPIIKEIKNNVSLISLLDFIFAKASYSLELDAVEPVLNDDQYISLKKVRHPLISKDKVVPITLELGKDYQVLVITGPNTGGKTVTLKTVGLICLMGASGLHIPASAGSSIYIFDNVFADIGDEQSIQESLSTFSSHMLNIIEILKESTSRSLILVDELGSGTDPIEGSSLAISILETFYKNHSLAIATTHYPEIKNYSLTHEGFENASCEFNVETLSPTYKLLIGIPGKSNAFAISKKLGLDLSILDRASEFLSSDQIHVEELLKGIYDNKLIIEKEKEEIEKNKSQIELLRKSLEKDYSDVQNKEKERIEAAKAEARQILLDAKEEATFLIKQMNELKKNMDPIKQVNDIRNKLNDDIKKLNTAPFGSTKPNENPISAKEIKVGMPIFVTSIMQEGTVLSLPNKSQDLQVQIGSLKMNVNISDLTFSSKKAPSVPKKNNSSSTLKAQHVSSEIQVIGQTVDEAVFVIDKYLDDCALAGLSPVRIVHGKGTGKLRQGIHTFLKKHPHVKSYRVGTFGEGEMGVTIVELK